MKYIYNIGKGELEDTTVPVNTQLNLFKEKPEPKTVKANYGNVKIIPNEKSTYPFDTPQGIDHATKIMKEEAVDRSDHKEINNINILNKEMKLSVLKDELGGVKKFNGQDKRTYPYDPEQKRRLKNISALEKSLGYSSPKADSWKDFKKGNVTNIVKEKSPSTWDLMKQTARTPQEIKSIRDTVNSHVRSVGNTKFLTKDEFKYLDRKEEAPLVSSPVIHDTGLELLEARPTAPETVETFEQFYARRENERKERQFNEDLKTGIGPLFKIHKRKFT